jgi:hypothetical protein
VNQPTKVLKLGRSYDLGALYGLPALLGYEFAVTETTMHGVRLNLTATPETGTGVHYKEEDSIRESG